MPIDRIDIEAVVRRDPTGSAMYILGEYDVQGLLAEHYGERVRFTLEVVHVPGVVMARYPGSDPT